MEHTQLPPWTKRRRIVTQVLMTVFILTAALFIGGGIYDLGVEYGWIRKPFSKQQITEELLNDPGFVRAVQKSAMSRTCTNPEIKFKYDYQPPFTEVINEGELVCTKLVTLHSTGADVLVEISKLDQSREVLAAELSGQFERVDTSLLTGTAYPTSRLSGVRQSIATELYIIGIDRQSAYVVTYAPTDPTLTGKVLALVESFHSIPQ